MKKLLIAFLLVCSASFGITQPSWLQLKDTPVFDVKAFGAKGDGSTDDSASVNAAAASASAIGGGVVFFPNSRQGYKIANINLPDRVSVAGPLSGNCRSGSLTATQPEEIASKIIPASTTGYIFRLNKGSCAENLFFEYPSQDFNLAAYTDSWLPTPVGILINGTGCKIRNVGFVGIQECIKQDDPSTSGAIEQLDIDGVYGMPLLTGISISFVTDTIFIRNVRFNPGTHGYLVRAQGGSEARVNRKLVNVVNGVKLGRVDAAHFADVMMYGVKNGFYFCKNMFSTDTNDGGSAKITNLTVDVCNCGILLERDMAPSFEVNVVNAEIIPTVVLASLEQAAVRVNNLASASPSATETYPAGAANSVSLTNLKCFGDSTTTVEGYPSTTNNAPYYLVVESGARSGAIFRVSNSQFVEHSEQVFIDKTYSIGQVYLNGGEGVGPNLSNGVKNKIINGDFALYTRQSTASETFTNTSKYVFDRWFVVGINKTSYVLQNVAGFTDPTWDKAISLFHWEVQGSGGAGDTRVAQYIDRWDSLPTGRATLSFNANALGVTSWHVYVIRTRDVATTTVEYLLNESFIPQGGFYQFSFDVPTRPNAYPTDGYGYEVSFVPDNNNATFTYQMWNVQLEEGGIATPFERRNAGYDRAICEQYYKRIAGAFSLGTHTIPLNMYRNPTVDVEGVASPSVYVDYGISKNAFYFNNLSTAPITITIDSELNPPPW